MCNRPLISVIVPIYNVGKWLNRCIFSICGQSYDNLQIILVDDGSTDNSGNLCNEYAQSDSRIFVIHQENGGLSDARNTGIKYIQGEYVCFVDSDDWLEKYFIENLYQAICINHAEIVGCEYRKCTEADDYCNTEKLYEQKIYSNLEAMSALIDNEIQQVVWNKLYKANILHGILFEKGKCHEDEFWTYQVLAKINKYVAISYVGYNYFQRSDSIMGEKYSLKRLDAVEAKSIRQSFLEKHVQSLAIKGRINLIFTCLYHGQLALIYLDENEKRKAFKYLQNIIKEFPVKIVHNKNVSIKQKIWLALTNVSFGLTCKLRNTLKIGF